jgi:hypothetical protein
MFSLAYWSILVSMSVGGLSLAPLNYSKSSLGSWFMPLLFLVANVEVLLWLWMLRVIDADDVNQVFVTGLIWDAVMTGSFCVVTLCVEMRWSFSLTVGALLVLAGLAVMKSCS